MKSHEEDKEKIPKVVQKVKAHQGVTRGCNRGRTKQREMTIAVHQRTKKMFQDSNAIEPRLQTIHLLKKLNLVDNGILISRMREEKGRCEMIMKIDMMKNV